MKICVINGSPKGKYSITLHTVLYLEKLFPEHRFSIIHAGQKIKSYEKDIRPALEEMEKADVLLFSYPVYTFLVPAQLHRFIELLKESGSDFSGKFATQITTSKHFYDVTAHRFIEDNCHDMGMKVVHGLSAEMDDLTTPQGQKDAVNFFKYLLFCVNNDIYEPPQKPHNTPKTVYRASLALTPKESGVDTVIVADLRDGDESLRAMIEDFKAAYPYTTRLVNIAEYPFSGGCLGCFNCAGDGKCIHKDGFDAFLREKIQTADAIVYAFTIKDHSMGARFKMYDDRQFCNGHRTVTEGKPIAYIVSGDYENEQNLRTVIEARCEVGHNFLGGVGYSAQTIAKTAARLAYAVREHYVQPRNFYGVGGMKIFRDFIFLLKGLMKADHEFYKKHGLYDFPQKRRWYILKMYLVGALFRNPKLKAKMGNNMNEGMIAPYKKVVDSAADKQ